MLVEKRAPDLIARTRAFSLSIIDFYSRMPRQAVAQILGRQLLRSATSVGAQYREAQRANSSADFISKTEGALQEVHEAGYWLEIDSGIRDRAQRFHQCAAGRSKGTVGYLRCYHSKGKTKQAAKPARVTTFDFRLSQPGACLIHHLGCGGPILLGRTCPLRYAIRLVVDDV
jgi:four helix bundle protein